jgi:hypothetical protein
MYPNQELERETSFKDNKWPEKTGMLQTGSTPEDSAVPKGLRGPMHMPTPRGYDHKDNGSRSTDAHVNVVAVLTPNGQHTEFVPLDSFTHCDGDDTLWDNWEVTSTKGRLSGGSFSDVLGATVFSSHRAHSQARAPFGVPVVKIFATFALLITPFAPTGDQARYSGLPQSMEGHPDPPPGDSFRWDAPKTNVGNKQKRPRNGIGKALSDTQD